MKHYLFHTAIIAAVLLTSAGCSHEEIFDRNSPGEKLEGRVITLTASMPEEPSATRIALTPEATGTYPAVNLAWEDGDEVQFCLVQGATKVKQTVTVGTISNGGKTGQFTITLPGTFTAGTFDIYGIYGGNLDQSDPAKAYIPQPSAPGSINGITPVLTLCQKEVSTSSPAVNAPFAHLGSLLCLSIQNTDAQALNITGKEFVLEGLNNISAGQGGFFDITAEAASFADTDKKTQVEFTSQESSIEATSTVKLWAWIIPTGEITGYLKLTTDGGTTQSSNVLHAGTPEAGNAYYINLTWDGIDFSFDGGVEYTPIEEFEISNGVLTKYNGTSTEVILPDEVTSIAANALAKSITKIYLNNVTELGVNAFKQYGNLTYVDAPNVVTMRAEAFNECTKLLAINCPKVTSVGRHAFQRTAMTTIDLSKVTTFTTDGVGGYLPGQQIFHQSAVQEVDLSSAEEITANMFQNCSKLTFVNMPNVETIKDNAFSNCTVLPSVNIPNVVTIEKSAFENCKALTSVNIPNVETIGINAFKSCSALTYVDAPNVETIKSEGFHLATGLETINCPKLRSIGDHAFQDCHKLTTLPLKGPVVEFTTQNSNSYAPGFRAFRHCNSFTTVDLTGFNQIIGGNQMFAECAALETVEFGNQTEIGPNMFAGCKALTTVNGQNVETLGEAAFNGCSALTTIDLPKLTTLTGIAAFQGTGLVEIDLSGITELTQSPNTGNLFRLCSKLKKVNLSNLTTMTTGGIFLGCTALEEVDLSSLEVMTGENLFANNDNTTNVSKLPYIALPSIKTIGANAFYKVTNMIVDLHEATELSTVAANAFPDVAGAGIQIYVATQDIANLFSSYTNIPVTVGAPQP
jgi:hypothetical protein